jgi:hypothetical protein
MFKIPIYLYILNNSINKFTIRVPTRIVTLMFIILVYFRYKVLNNIGIFFLMCDICTRFYMILKGEYAYYYYIGTLTYLPITIQSCFS